MSFPLANAPSGYYTIAQIHNVATTHFPDAYNALLPSSELAWEAVGIPGYHQHALVLGYIIVAGQLHKVLGCVALLDGAVRFITRSGVALTRPQNAQIKLLEPWRHLAEDVERPQLVNVKALCQFYFAAAHVSNGVNVRKKSWFVALEMSCRLVGEGMGVLPGELTGGALEDRGYEGGDEEEVTPGIQVKKVARIVQRLVGLAKGRNMHWAKHVEGELKNAWPGMKKHWKK